MGVETVLSQSGVLRLEVFTVRWMPKGALSVATAISLLVTDHDPRGYKNTRRHNRSEQRMGKVEMIASWELGRQERRTFKPMTEVTQRAKEDRNTVHLANLADLCHLKNADLATHLQNYKWRVVLLEDNVKDECGYMALFAEQGASASQMAAVNFFGHNFPKFLV